MNRPFIGADVDDLVRRFVRPGMHLHLAATMSRPNALLNAVCRVMRGHGDLTVSTTAVHSNAHALALSGAVRHVVTCFLGDTYPTPRPNRLYSDLVTGTPFTVESWSLSTYVQRLMAAATGQPYAVTGSLVGSDLAVGKGGDLHEIPDPARPGRSLALLTPLRPDLTLVHGVCADRRGNVVMCPPIGEGPWSAYAARDGVLASVERIVPDEVVDALPDRVVVPARCVVGLCEAPLGAHPQSLRTAGLADVPGYVDDYDFMEEIVDACRQGRATSWFDTWVAGPTDHASYLAALGPERIDSLRIRDAVPDVASRTAERRGTPSVPTAFAPPAPSTSTPTEVTDQERLVVLGARAIVDLVASGAYDMLLAGIGTSHMSAWLAAELLRRRGTDVCVAAELGLVDMSPHPGDVFLFSQRHVARSTQLAGIPEVLGPASRATPDAWGPVGGGDRRTGNINTTLLPDGRWVTGSGGAHDIASGADCLVVAPASPRRYVRRVTHLTSPGRRVVEVASQFGRFRRAAVDGPFELATWCPPDTPHPLPPEDLLGRSTSWTPRVAPRLHREPDITPEEIAVLRDLDPEGRYR